MAGGALVGLGWVSTLGMFYFFYFFNALGYVCGGPFPNQVLLSRWFDKSRGKAMGFAYLGIGIGGATVPWISHALIQHFGWQAALRFLGVLIILSPFRWHFSLRRHPPNSFRILKRRTSGSHGRLQDNSVLSAYIRQHVFDCGGERDTAEPETLLSLDRHFSQGDAARVLSLVLSFSIAGRLLMGWLADRFSKKYVMLLTYLLVAAGIPFLFLAHSQAVMYAAAALFGVGLGGDYMIIPLMTAEIFGMQVLGSLLGVILTAGGIAEAVSPWLTGRLRDTTGNYSESCFVLVGIALLGAAVVLGLPQRGRQHDSKSILRLGTVKNVTSFKEHLHSLGLMIPCDDELLNGPASPLRQPLVSGKITIGNRIVVHPMEGWDGSPDGNPSENTIRRWQRFGRSGAKLIWGGEAVAVSHGLGPIPINSWPRRIRKEACRRLRATLIEEHRLTVAPTMDC